MSNQLLKVFNLTDVETPQLKQYGLVNQHIVVERALVAPGEYTQVADSPVARAHLRHYVSVGAVAVDVVPPSYVLLKERNKPPPVVDSDNTAVPFKKKKKEKSSGSSGNSGNV